LGGDANFARHDSNDFELIIVPEECPRNNIGRSHVLYIEEAEPHALMPSLLAMRPILMGKQFFTLHCI
jgi:hypothetical protein